LNAGLWLRRVRRDMFPSCSAASSPHPGRESTYRPVQFWPTTSWNSRWQQLDAHNDDAVDGLILLESGGEMTGQVIFVQVKCSRRKLRDDGNRSVAIEARQLTKHERMAPCCWRGSPRSRGSLDTRGMVG